MANDNDDDMLKLNEKVVAVEDLPGVPAGTAGRVTIRNGFRWIRYRVYFDNGADFGPIDRDQLMRRKEWEQEQKRRAEEERARRLEEITNSLVPD